MSKALILGDGVDLTAERHEMNECTHLLGFGVLDGVDEGGELVAHGLCGDAGGGGLEVDMARAADAGVEGVALGHEGVGRHRSARG